MQPMQDVLEQANNAILNNQEAAIEDGRQVLSFAVVNENYAIPIDRVKEILEYTIVTPVPMTPAYMRGVLNLRGSVIPIVDLSVRLGRPRGVVGKRSCIIVISLEDEDEQVSIGFMVDAVNEVLHVPESHMEPAPSFGLNVRADFIAAMARVRDRFVTILDAESTFSTRELAQLIGQRA